MKRTLIFFVIVLDVLCSIAVNAMDVQEQIIPLCAQTSPDRDDDISDILSTKPEIGDPRAQSDKAADCKKQIIKEVTKYETNLMRALGCDLCNGFMSIFKKEKHGHILERLQQLKRFAERLKGNTTAEDISAQVSILMLELTTVKSIAGRILLSTCQDVMAKIASEHADDANDQSICLVCMDNLRCVAALPCRHLAFCATCYLRYKNAEQTECPCCRGRIMDYSTMSKCALCNEYATMLIENCGHFAYCRDCFDKREKRADDSCPECKVPNPQFKEVYRY